LSRLLWLLAPLALSACPYQAPFECANDVRCAPEGGARCIFDGATAKYCAFPDSDCPTEWRWDKYARSNLAGRCVDPVYLVDGGATPDGG
jgi:hypothetical protein